ncbi:MAG: hypothetical protein HY738_11355 [Bacteroidia bacterium]|nr:hypothetical protein [Bacteroidia bacterium]
MFNVISIGTVLYLFFSYGVYSQCCSAGSGSPIAGGTSHGVLMEKQFELNGNYQYIQTRKFLTGDSDARDFLDKYFSNYGYFRMAYGLNKNFTLSIESGYYFNKTQIGLNKTDTNSSSGIGDLIIFPRYQVYNKTYENGKFEMTIGMGIKIPLGKYNDSVGKVEPFSGQKYYITMPPAVQPTNGSHDFIFYSFIYREWHKKSFKIFANGLYLRKGWNPNGEKFGDYASIGIFIGKIFFHYLGATLQLKGEWIAKMKYNNDVYLMGSYNYDPEDTGNRKILLVPQLSYAFKNRCTIYLLSEFPVYQYVNKTQIASQYLITAGISYRFMLSVKSTEK